MSILIKGMKMPKDGTKIFAIRTDGMVEDSMGCCVGKAIAIPDHGRLIDADALEKELDSLIMYSSILTQLANDCINSGIRLSIKRLNDTPTIIPADKEGAK